MQVLEEIRFWEELPAAGATVRPPAPLAFEVSEARVAAARATYERELRKEGAGEEEAGVVAEALAASLSGVAMWPQLALADGIEARSRAGDGGARKSHWQTVRRLWPAEHGAAGFRV